MAEEMKGRVVGGDGKVAEFDGTISAATSSERTCLRPASIVA
jgi:hypothetical protein